MVSGIASAGRLGFHNGSSACLLGRADPMGLSSRPSRRLPIARAAVSLVLVVAAGCTSNLNRAISREKPQAIEHYLAATTGVGFVTVPKTFKNNIDAYEDELAIDQSELVLLRADRTDLLTKIQALGAAGGAGTSASAPSHS